MRHSSGGSSPRVPPAASPAPAAATAPSRARSQPGDPHGARSILPRTAGPRPFGPAKPPDLRVPQQFPSTNRLYATTGLTKVQTHPAPLFRQTPVTASSADCSRDEQTHTNYRLNFAIHLSKARNISETALITPTNPPPADGTTHETSRKKIKLSLFFSLSLPSLHKCMFQANKGWSDKITSESSRAHKTSVGDGLATSGQPQKRTRSLQHRTLSLCRRAKSQFFKATSFCPGLV